MSLHKLFLVCLSLEHTEINLNWVETLKSFQMTQAIFWMCLPCDWRTPCVVGTVAVLLWWQYFILSHHKEIELEQLTGQTWSLHGILPLTTYHQNSATGTILINKAGKCSNVLDLKYMSQKVALLKKKNIIDNYEHLTFLVK